MNTLAFTFGVVCTIAAIFVAVLVWTIVKVVKQEKKLKQLNDDSRDQFNSMWRQKEEDRRWQNENEREFHRSLDSRFKDLEGKTDNHTSDLYRNLAQLEDEIHRVMNDQITDAVTQSKSYTDSRIDKLIEGNKTKQVIKG